MDMTYFRTLTHFAPHEAAALLYDVLPDAPEKSDDILILQAELTAMAAAIYPDSEPDSRVFPRVYLRNLADNRGLEPQFLNQETLYDTGLSREEFLKAAAQEMLGGDWEQVYEEEIQPFLDKPNPT
jgi:hypothetical protein